MAEQEIDLEALEEFAKAASPGPWDFEFGGPEQEDDGSWYEPDQSGLIVVESSFDASHDEAALTGIPASRI